MEQTEMKIQLQEILLPQKDICKVAEMYVHKKGKMLEFNGYFNLFYIEKWKQYTMVEHLYISFWAEGYQKLLLFHDQSCVGKYPLEPDCRKEYEAEFPLSDYETGVFWFALVKAEDAPSQLVSGFYTGISKKCWDVALGVDICTFCREEYVEKNIKLLLTRIINRNGLQVSGNVWIYLVDNGQTLKEHRKIMEAIKNSKGRIRVLTNKNAGGAGGFTRGLLQILEEKQAKGLTHTLLMDDDIVLEPDLFVRIYGFLRMRKKEWKDITLGGTMLQAEQKYRLFAAGESWHKGVILNDNKGIDLRYFKSATSRRLLAVHNEKTMYSGWWCCCYSLEVVREDNLPLPLFLHHDDIEFGLRNRKYGIVFLNGVSVWHRNFEYIPPGSNLYYDIRNALIEIALRYGEKRAARYLWQFYWKRLAVRMLRGRKEETVYVLCGAKDFLKGPKWLWEQEPEQLHHKVKDLRAYEMANLWWHSINICWELFWKRRKVVLDYQKNMYQYATRLAWEKYLDIL